MGLQLHRACFPWSSTHSVVVAIPEIRVILSAASDLTSAIHNSLKISALLNIQEGIWQSEKKGNYQGQKVLGKRKKTVIGIFKIGRNFSVPKILLDLNVKNESTISIINILTIISIKL